MASTTYNLPPTTSTFFKRKKSRIPQDLIGNIAILKFPRKTFKLIKILKARKFLKQHKNLTTVVEKTDKIEGELRTHKTKHLAGLKTKIATYKENDCTFKFNIDESYFSPRLSNERKIIADEVAKIIKPTTDNRQPTTAKSKTINILVLFAGIAPYPIIIAKRLLSNTDHRIPNTEFHIYANELNKEANKEAQKNITLNKLQDYITLLPGDANKLPRSTKTLTHLNTNTLGKFDIILMPRPNLPNTFLKTALKLSKKNTTIFYHGFGTKEEVLNEIKRDTKNKIGKIKIRKAGDIGPYIYRWQAQFKVK